MLVWATCVLSSTQFVSGESNWTGWRGPSQNGHTVETNLPVAWNADSVTWKASLKGRGQSSPIIWGERIFLTTATGEGRQRIVFCVDRNDGHIVWEHECWTGDPEKSHVMNGHASASCTTDGERVYAFFGKGGLHCYTVDGKPVWSKDLGEFVVTSGWGTAASPVLVDDMVIQNCDADVDAYLIALDKRTGQEVWKTKREDYRGWNTPVLIEANGRRELIVNGHTGVRAYDPATGEELWFCSAGRGRGTPMATPHHGVLYLLNGLGGHGLYAVRPGGNGDVTASQRLWLAPRRARDLPSPILIDHYCLVVPLRGGILTCYDARTGKEVGEPIRMGDAQFAASPIAYNGLALFLAESGVTYVVQPGPQTKVIGENPVGASDDEIFRASITVSEGQLFLRSDRNLYCLGKRLAQHR